MQNNHQITLSSAAWSELTEKLTHSSQESRQKRNAFFEEIRRDIQITYTQDSILVAAKNLDEAAILAALTAKKQGGNSSAGINRSFSIQMNFSVAADAFSFRGDRMAGEDTYQACPHESPIEYVTLGAECFLQSA